MDIKTIISQHGISQVELAKRMNPELNADQSQMNEEQRQELQKRQKSANSYVSQLISGKSDPSMKKLDLMASLIGCQRWEFFLDEIRAAGFDIVKAQPEQPEQSASEKQSQESTNENPQPSAIGQQAIVCPHCHQALVMNIASYEQK